MTQPTILLTIETVSVTNDHTEQAGMQVDCIAAIAYGDVEPGAHFVVPGTDEAARFVLLELIEGCGYPYEIAGE